MRKDKRKNARAAVHAHAFADYANVETALEHSSSASIARRGPAG